MTAATMPFQTDPCTAAIGAAIVLGVLANGVACVILPRVAAWLRDGGVR